MSHSRADGKRCSLNIRVKILDLKTVCTGNLHTNFMHNMLERERDQREIREGGCGTFDNEKSVVHVEGIRVQARQHRLKAFVDVLMTENVDEGLCSLIQVSSTHSAFSLVTIADSWIGWHAT